MVFDVVKDAWNALWPPEGAEAESPENARRHRTWRRSVFGSLMGITIALVWISISYATSQQVTKEVANSAVPITSKLNELALSSAITNEKLDTLTAITKRRAAENIGSQLFDVQSRLCKSRNKELNSFLYRRRAELSAYYQNLTQHEFPTPGCAELQ